jgi:hypothetical protein
LIRYAVARSPLAAFIHAQPFRAKNFYKFFMKQNLPQPVHIAGTKKGEQAALHEKEPGRGEGQQYRSARDSTGINAKNRGPIAPLMPRIPCAR